MLEVPYNWYMPFTGRLNQAYFFAARSSRIPDIPSSIHCFQVFLDRLFRFAGFWNWLSPVYVATNRTTITDPAEQQIVEVVLRSGDVAIN
jgi:hypothetical protein